MKTTLLYSTSMTLSIHALGMVAELDMGCKPLDAVLKYADCIFKDDTMFHSECIEKVYVIDSKTGELIAECVPEKSSDDDYGDWDFNEDMGFDPYMGCYTDDC